MSLHAILEVIRASGEARVREIESRSYRQAREIIANTRLEAEAVKEQARTATLEPAARERARILHRARLDALQVTGSARQELIDSALKQAHGRLAGLRSHTIYPEVLRRLLQEALAELASSPSGDERDQLAGSVCLEVDPRDRALMDHLLHQMGLCLPVHYSLECWGGLVAKSEDSRVVVINTLEARLERATPYLRGYLAALFEGELTRVKESSVYEISPVLQRTTRV